MHPRNNLRLLAGLTIDHSLEVTESKKEISATNNDESKKTRKLKAKKAGTKFTGMNGKGEDGPNKKMKDMKESADGPHGAVRYRRGDRVLYDNGVWLVHVADANADMIGIIPPSMASASQEEKAKAMQQVKPDKIRKPSEEETKIMAGPDGILGTADDVKLESTSSMGRRRERMDAEIAKTKAETKKKKENERIEAQKKIIQNESTLNYTQSNAQSFEDEESDPANVVGQAKKQWANSLDPQLVKNEYTSQLDDKGPQSMDDEANKVKVPTKLKSAMKDAINAFIKDAEKTGNSGHTAQEKRQFFLDTAEAFQELLDHLEGGTIMDIKKAQIFASSIMGPMLHKLPDGVWDFLTNGGQKRSLKDYMNKVKM